MKQLFKSIFLLALLLNGCTCDAPDTSGQVEDETMEEATATVGKEVIVVESKVVPIDERDDLNPEAKETMKNRMSASPFFGLGCCAEEKNQVNSCCGDEVIKEYEIMLNEGDKRLAKLNMEDPILDNCKNGVLKKEFELLDFGEEEEESWEL